MTYKYGELSIRVLLSVQSIPTPTPPTTPTFPPAQRPVDNSALQDGPRFDESIVVQRRTSDSPEYLYEVLHFSTYSRGISLSRMCPFRKSRMMKSSSKVCCLPQLDHL